MPAPAITVAGSWHISRKADPLLAAIRCGFGMTSKGATSIVI
jgi:hypothetical protein